MVTFNRYLMFILTEKYMKFAELNDEQIAKLQELYKGLKSERKFQSLSGSEKNYVIFSLIPRLISNAETLGKDLEFEDISDRIGSRGYHRISRLINFANSLESEIPEDIEIFRKKLEFAFKNSEKNRYMRQINFSE